MAIDNDALLTLPPRFTHGASIRFQDVDAAQLVFYARLFDYLHDAYVAFLASVGQPLPAVLAERRWVAPIRHAEVDYLRPLRFGDAIAVQLVGAEFARGVMTLGYRVDGPDGGAAATGSTVHVFIDPATWKRCDAPPEVTLAFSALSVAAPA